MEGQGTEKGALTPQGTGGEVEEVIEREVDRPVHSVGVEEVGERSGGCQVVQDQGVVGGDGRQVGLLEGQGTSKGSRTPPEPVPGCRLEGQGTKKGTLTPQKAGEEVEKERKKKDPKLEMSSLMRRMREKAKEMDPKKQEAKKTPAKKTPASKRKKEKEVEEENNKMRRVLDNWRKKEAPKNDEKDEKLVEKDKTVVNVVVVEEILTNKNKTCEVSAVKKARDKFQQMSSKQEDSFKRWREKRALEKGLDRSAVQNSKFNLNVQNLGVGARGAEGEGAEAVDGGEPAPGCSRADSSKISGRLSNSLVGGVYTSSSGHGKTGFLGED